MLGKGAGRWVWGELDGGGLTLEGRGEEGWRFVEGWRGGGGWGRRLTVAVEVWLIPA